MVIQGITKSLDISQAELEEIRKANQVLQEKVKSEIGISEEKIQNSSKFKNKNKKTLLFTALGSGSGKTLLVTGIAGALKKNGLNVGVVKIGGDIRDVVPTLYLIKEPMRGYTSIKVGESGWMDASQAVNMATIDYDFLIIEGAMSAFTGLLNDQVKRPSSTLEIAAILRSPTVIVVGCDKEGVEGALVSTLNYVRLLRKLGVNVVGVLLNKVRTSYLNDEIKELMKQAFSNVGIEILGIVPRIDLEGRGAIPEIEIKYEAFGEKAMDLAESSIDFNKLIEMAGPFKNSELEFNELVEEFKNSILNDYMLKETDGKKEE